MSAPSLVKRGLPGLPLVLAGALLVPLSSHADLTPESGFALRNQNPFLHVCGLPPFQSATLVGRGLTAWNLSLDLANHADFGDTDIENFSIDGESWFLTVSMRRRINDRLELGFDLPLVSHTDGVMDDLIEGWHDLFGMPNTKRQGPSNELSFVYQRQGADVFRLESRASGVGDLQLTAAMPIRSGTGGRTRLAVRSSLKLSTGDSQQLLGSGGTDFAIGLYATRNSALIDRTLQLNGFVGGLALGDGDVLPSLQRDAVAFGGASATWHWTDRLALHAQLYGQTSYYHSDVEELGGNSMQLAAGAVMTLRNGSRLRLAITEDVSANATTDFAIHASFTFVTGGGP